MHQPAAILQTRSKLVVTEAPEVYTEAEVKNKGIAKGGLETRTAASPNPSLCVSGQLP